MICHEAAIAMERGHNGLVEVGDVLAIRPHPWDWGLEEVRRYLIIPVRCCQGPPLIQSLWRNIYTGDVLTMSELARLPADGIKDGQYRLQAKSDHATTIQLIRGFMPDFSGRKMRHHGTIYQPFLSASRLVRRFDGRGGRHRVAAQDVDTDSIVSQREAELIVDADKLIGRKGRSHALVKKVASSLQHKQLR